MLSERTRYRLYCVGGVVVVVATWLNPSPGVAVMAFAVLFALFCIAMSAGPEEPTAALTSEPHACMDDALEWDDTTQSYDWVCPHSETTS